ncbi:hypothetical protein J6590_057406 [Homalodisca vitripennis]|nr:hypothetical protein J6590_057406 [Homalodisca vitripennis]
MIRNRPVDNEIKNGNPRPAQPRSVIGFHRYTRVQFQFPLYNHLSTDFHNVGPNTYIPHCPVNYSLPLAPVHLPLSADYMSEEATLRGSELELNSTFTLNQPFSPLLHQIGIRLANYVVFREDLIKDIPFVGRCFRRKVFERLRELSQ